MQQTLHLNHLGWLQAAYFGVKRGGLNTAKP